MAKTDGGSCLSINCISWLNLQQPFQLAETDLERCLTNRFRMTPASVVEKNSSGALSLVNNYNAAPHEGHVLS